MMNDTIQHTSKPRLYMLDALRGSCAVSLMFYHLLAWNGTDVFQIGTFGVYLFYVLSGFSMWYVYAEHPLSPKMLRTFFLARFARIFPLYFLVCLISVMARVFAKGAGSLDAALLHRFILNTTFLFGFNDPGKNSIMPGGWSIGIEWVFYICFPIFLLFVRKLWIMWALLVVGLIINLLTTNTLLDGGQTLEAQWIPYTQFPTFLVYFVAGITAAEMFTRLHRRGIRVSPFVGAWACRLVPLAALALIFFYPNTSVEDYLRGAHVVVLVGVAMLAMIFGAMLDRITGLEIRIYRFLGEISYSTYLLFFFVYSAMQRVIAHITPSFATLAAASVVSTLLLAYLVYRFYEMPMRRWINHIGRTE